MTNDIRSGSSTVGHIGMAFGKELYVAIHWRWLSLPVSLLALSGVFLVGTMIKTSKELGHVGVWKTSATATLLYSCPEEIESYMTSSTTNQTTPRKGFRDIKDDRSRQV